MNTKAALGLTAGALAVGLLAGLALGADDGGKAIEVKGSGPTPSVAGAPVGYARSRAGAVAAATSYMQVLNEATSLTPKERQAIIGQIAAVAARDEVTTRADEVYAIVDKAAPKDGSLIARSGALAFRVDAYETSNAIVALWAVDVIGASGSGAQSGWGTKTVTLTWEKDDWKLASFPQLQRGANTCATRSALVVRHLHFFCEGTGALLTCNRVGH